MRLAGEREGNLSHGQPLSVSPCKDVGIKAILPLPHRVFASHSHRHPPGQMSDIPNAGASLRSPGACSRPFTRSATSTTAPSASTSLNCSDGWIFVPKGTLRGCLLHSIG